MTETMGMLVDADWLMTQAGASDLVILEATQFLPDDGREGRDAYLDAHIPGAHFFDLDVIADVETTLPHMLPTAGRFARLAGALGVGDTTRVVFYDQNGGFWATRGWWMMGVFGHDRAAVLDGGLAAWRRAGFATANGQVVTPEPVKFTPRLRAGRVRGLGDMMQTDALVLDARSAARFAGRMPEPRPGLQPGHMPGAVNLPHAALVGPDGRFLPPDALRERLLAAGTDGVRPVVTTCGSGISATMVAFAMVRAGLPMPAVYDGSWAEWGADPLTPKETD